MTTTPASLNGTAPASQRSVAPGRVGRFWPLFVVALIALNVAIVTVTVIAATSDQSFAIEPDYYRQALAWDDTARQREVNTQLGWNAGIEITPATAAGTPAEVRITLKDRAGAPIPGASVDVIAFPKARSHDRATLVLGQREPGVYAAPIGEPRPGFWQVRVHAQVGDTVFTARQTVHVSEGPGGEGVR